MLSKIRHKSYLTILALLAVMVSVVSCSDRQDAPWAMESVNEAIFTINMGDVATVASRTTPTDGEYAEGAGLENYIDIEGEDYACYLFTTDNVFVSKLTITNIYKIDTSTSGRTYSVRAALHPFEVNAIDAGCKVVVLANWDAYPNVEAGRTTINDLSESASVRFAFTEDMKALSGANLIPMYGVKSIASGAATKQGDTYQIGDVRLLRAFAKVEVKPTFTNFPEGANPRVESITLTNCNNAGYKMQAIDYASEEYDYVHNSWTTDYAPVNVPANAETFPLQFDKDEETGNYIIYMPEYNNFDALGKPRQPADRARIKVTFVTDGSNVECIGYLDFLNTASVAAVSTGAEGTDTAAPQGTYLDVARNNWYIFNVTILPHDIEWTVDVQPYALAELSPGFGIERDDDGNILVRNEKGKIIRIITPEGNTYEGSDFKFPGGISGSNFIDKNNNVMIRLFDDGRRQVFDINRSWDLYDANGNQLEMFDYDGTDGSNITGTWSRFDPYNVLIERRINATLAENQLDVSGGSLDVKFKDDNGGTDVKRTKDVYYLDGSDWKPMVHVEVVYHLDNTTIATAINAPYTQKFQQKETTYTYNVAGVQKTQTARELFIADNEGQPFELRFRFFNDKSYQKLYTDNSFDTFTAEGVRTVSYSSVDPSYGGKATLTHYDPWNHIVERWTDAVPNADRTNASSNDTNKVVKYEIVSANPVSPKDLYFSIFYKINGEWVKFYDIAKNGDVIKSY